MKIKEPAEALVEFLQANIDEPIREFKGTQYVKRIQTSTQNRTGDGSTKFFTITNTPLVAITSVTVNAVAKVKYKDFDIDLARNGIFFNTAPTSGHAIVINYKYRSGASSVGNWIFPDKPRLDLDIQQYPRISTVLINNPGEMRGWNSSQYFHEGIQIQVDLIVKKGVLCSVDSLSHTVVIKNGGQTGLDFSLSE